MAATNHFLLWARASQVLCGVPLTLLFGIINWNLGEKEIKICFCRLRLETTSADERENGVRFPTGDRNVSLDFNLQTHQLHHSVGTKSSSLRRKALECEKFIRNVRTLFEKYTTFVISFLSYFKSLKKPKTKRCIKKNEDWTICDLSLEERVPPEKVDEYWPIHCLI